MLSVASQMMRDGASPSVSDVAEKAGVSRSTAYRYFPTRATMVQEVVGETLGPILKWQSDSDDPGDRIASLIRESFPRIAENESTFRAALRLSLEQQDTTDGSASNIDGNSIVRGHRIGLLDRALDPLKSSCSEPELRRLSQALSIIFGIEALVIMKDFWGEDIQTTVNVAEWATRALIDATIQGET